MTNEEALIYIKSKRILDADFVEDRKAMGVVIEALEKQIPKKPKILNAFCLCPRCYAEKGFSYDFLVGMKQTIDADISYCLGCGQAIDLEEVSENDD